MARLRKNVEAADPLPDWVEPQLTQLVESPPTGDGWAHEIKYHGYRIHVRLDHGIVRLLTRSGLDWTERYKEIRQTAATIGAATAYLDGELCALRPDGTTSFAELQAATEKGSTGALIYIAFDLLYLSGQNLMALPLIERKERLRALLTDAPPSIRYGNHVIGAGKNFYEQARRLNVEGIVSKRIDAPYVPGNRGLWQKIKCYHQQEFVIVGYSDPERSRPYLGALLLAYYSDDGRLIYAGRAGTGMSARELRRLYERLKPLATAKTPLDVLPPRASRYGSPASLARVHWVRPELVCEVRFMNWTAGGLLRVVSYIALRDDKPAKEVRRPMPTHIGSPRACAGGVANSFK
jgi:DNA ligase D-like protein (predicted ligase)